MPKTWSRKKETKNKMGVVGGKHGQKREVIYKSKDELKAILSPASKDVILFFGSLLREKSLLSGALLGAWPRLCPAYALQ